MKDEWIDALREMRGSGWAVIAWVPEELGDADPGLVEDRCIELGWEIIGALKSVDTREGE